MGLRAIACLLAALAAATARAQVPAGGEFRVNSFTTSYQTSPRLALDNSGRFVVSWTSRFQASGAFDVFGQRYAESGVPAGGEFQINTTTYGAGLTRIAFTGRGAYVVVWHGPGSPGFDIYGQRYDAASQPVSGEFRVNTYTEGNEYRPDVAALPGGGFVVCWSGHATQGPFANRIVARLFDASGAALGPEIAVEGPTTTGANFPAVAAAPDGTFVIAWKRISNVVGRRFDAAGNPLGAEFQVNQFSGELLFAFPRVAMAADGSFVVAFEHPAGDPDGHAIHARRFSAAAVPAGPEFRVNVATPGHQRWPSIAADGLGDFVIAWSSQPPGGDTDVFARRFDRLGAPRAGEFRVNSYTTATQSSAELGGDEVGNFVVAWYGAGPDGDGRDVFAKRFGGLLPAAAAVDTAPGLPSDGNGVLEPGEGADLRPSWRNVNGAAQSVNGALSGFTGPAGASYAITDGSGTYGTVPDGATAACLDCYGVSVSAPSRPALHWDATAVESISPEAQGQRKVWRLHVGDSFTDVERPSPYYLVVETLLHHGVTGGCSPTGYCPQASTLREQMPVFVLIAREGPAYRPPACGTPLFADVPASSPYCRFIEELARRQVVVGCDGANYCPSAPVSREQMAVFTLRTLDPLLTPPDCTTPVFPDVPASSPFCRWIEELARRGVVGGCGGGRYCPLDPVTREQMAVFIADGFGLQLYGP